MHDFIKKRQSIAKIIEKRINEELNDLNMKDAEFKINFEKKMDYLIMD